MAKNLLTRVAYMVDYCVICLTSLVDGRCPCEECKEQQEKEIEMRSPEWNDCYGLNISSEIQSTKHN